MSLPSAARLGILASKKGFVMSRLREHKLHKRDYVAGVDFSVVVEVAYFVYFVVWRENKLDHGDNVAAVKLAVSVQIAGRRIVHNRSIIKDNISVCKRIIAFSDFHIVPL